MAYMMSHANVEQTIYLHDHNVQHHYSSSIVWHLTFNRVYSQLVCKTYSSAYLLYPLWSSLGFDGNHLNTSTYTAAPHYVNVLRYNTKHCFALWAAISTLITVMWSAISLVQCSIVDSVNQSFVTTTVNGKWMYSCMIKTLLKYSFLLHSSDMLRQYFT